MLDIVADYKDLADSLIGYNLAVDLIVTNGTDTSTAYGYPAEVTKTAEGNLSIKFKLIGGNQPIVDTYNVSAEFPLDENGRIDFLSKKVNTSIGGILGLVGGTIEKTSTVDGDMLTQPYTKPGVPGGVTLHISKGGPFGLSPFSGS